MIKLSEIDTRAPKGWDKDKTKATRITLAEQLAELQHVLYAEQKHSLLIILQGLDASGKDGVTRKVFADCSPSGVRAYAFKKPSEKEMNHDFLWRIHQKVPQVGMVHIFNRSHYEDVLIQRVNKWIDEDHVQNRIDAINDFENLLQFDGKTHILKFYLHLSRDRQKQKLQERIDDPKKQWKHNDNDWVEAEKWDDYMAAYEDILHKSIIPWHIIPADQKWYRDYLVAKYVCDYLESLHMKLPSLRTNR